MPELLGESNESSNISLGRETIIAVGGVPFRALDLHGAVDWLARRVLDKRVGLSVRLANAYCIALTNSHEEYRRLMTEHGVNFPDGMPVALVMRGISRSQGLPTGRVGRVRGPSFFEQSLDRGREHHFSHFFLGTTPETLARLQANVELKFPGVSSAGTYAPPFAPLSDSFISDCADRINNSGADIVWVGLGTPKQDFLTTELARLTGRHCVGVGAAFDFTAGTAREAPKWIQNSGFEWLYRLATEPKRLWKRYLVGNFEFASVVVRKNFLHK
ncbi:WecB/TagA/CpsF family glycosyltransferase [Arthrobacter sp. SAFR-014]|uniref:WecB/TagA/CpsF family glycosyltransferase n=1 Tax=unclassified Arthrobacter TaxID=235627 RepID=UPI003F7BE3AA